MGFMPHLPGVSPSVFLQKDSYARFITPVVSQSLKGSGERRLHQVAPKLLTHLESKPHASPVRLIQSGDRPRSPGSCLPHKQLPSKKRVSHVGLQVPKQQPNHHLRDN